MADLVERQAAIDALDKLCNRECEYSKKQRYAMCGACHLGSAFDAIAELPSVQPERKTGKWIRETKHYKDAEQEFYYYEERCSECGAKRKIGWGEVIYCPNCGARMESCTSQ